MFDFADFIIFLFSVLLVSGFLFVCLGFDWLVLVLILVWLVISFFSVHFGVNWLFV